MAFLRDFFVLSLTKETGWFWVVFNLKQPDFLSRLIHCTGVACYLLVDFHNFTRNWTVNISSHLHAFDCHCWITTLDVFADGGKLYVNNLSELWLCEIGDTDSGSFLSINSFDPFVGFGELDSWVRVKRYMKRGRGFFCWGGFGWVSKVWWVSSLVNSKDYIDIEKYMYVFRLYLFIGVGDNIYLLIVFIIRFLLTIWQNIIDWQSS